MRNPLMVSQTKEDFFITFDDLINFTENKEGKEKTISLSINKNLKIKTKTKDIFEFMDERIQIIQYYILEDFVKDRQYIDYLIEDRDGKLQKFFKIYDDNVRVINELKMENIKLNQI